LAKTFGAGSEPGSLIVSGRTRPNQRSVTPALARPNWKRQRSASETAFPAAQSELEIAIAASEVINQYFICF
jgi:hypothetical protein